VEGRAGRAPTAPDPADPKASPSLIGLVEELQRVMPACWNLALVLTQEIFGIHVKGAGDILRRANGLYKESRPAFQVHLVKRPTEVLQLDGAVLFVHSHYFEEATLGMPVPPSD